MDWEFLLFHDDGGCPILMDDDENFSSDLTPEEEENFSKYFGTGY
jgi:hypothetical protein